MPLSEDAIKNGYTIITVESCTAGLLAGEITASAGASKYYHGGFVVYDNEAKQRFVNVQPSLLESFGAVSAECAEAMAKGAIDNYPDANLSLSVTGIAGPGGGTGTKPVGLVYFGCYNTKTKALYSSKMVFKGDRDAIRRKAVNFALECLEKEVKN